jgi:predicted RNA-binding protein YlqC (UPF0109 family)
VSHAREVVEVVARALVDAPDEVKVTDTVNRGVSVIELHVAAEDLGRVIGRQGRTAAAIRTLVAVTAERDGERATLEIRDERGHR